MKIDFESIRAKFAREGKERVWRSFEELVGSGEFEEFLRHEFPRQASAMQAVSRRDFLKLLAAPLAMAGLSACVPQPEERIAPYIEAPEELVPGVPLFFATAMELGGYGRGLLVESNMGRPTKVEGNPQHPASLGATDPFAQGSVLSLYDPERAQVVTNRGRIRTYQEFLSVITQALITQDEVQGAGLRILTGTVTSPTLASQIAEVMDILPESKWHQYDAINRDNVRSGAELAFGEIVESRYHFDKAAVVVSLDNDFTFVEPGNVRYAHDFAEQRRVTEEPRTMNRLYVIESQLTNPGAIADHRLALKPSQIENFARLLARQLGLDVEVSEDEREIAQGWIEALVVDLNDNQGSCLILAGPQQPPAVHALAHLMNERLGNVGNTITYTDPVEPNPVNQIESLRDLVRDLNAGRVDLLLILEGNPVYSAPADVNFAEQLPKAGLSVYLGLYNDETALLSDWHLPATHYLEMWSDVRAYDGTVSIVQPLIEPLYNGVSPHELLAIFLGETSVDGYEIVRRYWQEQLEVEDFEGFWKRTLHDGFMPDSEMQSKEVTVSEEAIGSLTGQAGEPEGDPEGLEILFQPDPSIWDGRFANNAWLQELPKPLTKLTWDNAALISPGTAEKLGLSNEELVELQIKEFKVPAPVWILPGQPADTVAVHLGYGRAGTGSVLEGAGFNANRIRTSESFWFGSGLKIQKLGEHYPLATTQHHHSMEGRHLVRAANLEEFIQNPELFREEEPEADELPSIYPEFEYDGDAWGMSINLNACIGCNACVIACQAENNIPTVGKEQVQNAREMHWLRVDRYFKGDLDNPEVYFQPVPCMHCERAPCEPVCPVEATLHNSEGLNEMIYNRCVGTRYCSNNCPYKVRRFNFFEYVDDETIPLKMARNPEVTVRSRGVMEKCTYCIQRINNTRNRAEVEERPIKDGEIKTACQQACPTNAIVFGNINDETSQVSASKNQPHDYSLLAELNTKPRTTYLAKLRNPNPRLENRG